MPTHVISPQEGRIHELSPQNKLMCQKASKFVHKMDGYIDQVHMVDG